MLRNASLLANIGADTAQNDQHFAEILPIGREARRKEEAKRKEEQRVEQARRMLVWCALGSATGGKHVSAISHSSNFPFEIS